MAQIILGPNRAYPALPTVGDDLESHRRAIEAIVECIQIHERRTNDVLDSFVRVQELETLGLVQIDGKIVSDVATEESTTHHHDSTYLRLDGTNDPVTGSVSFSGGLSATGLTAGGAIDFSGKTSFTGLSGTELDDAANIAFLNQAETVLSAWTFNEDLTLDTAKLIIDDGVEQITLDAGVIISTYHGIWLNQTAPDTFNYALLGDTGGQTYLNAKTRTYIRINNSNMFDIDNTSIDVHRPMRMMTNNKLTLFDSLGTTSVELDFNSTTFEVTGVGAGAVHIDFENIGSLDLRSGAYLVTRDSTNVDALTIQTVLNENRFTGTGVTSTTWIDPGIFDLKDGATLRIRDAADTAYLSMGHDGTDFQALFTNTTRFELDGAASMDLGGGMDIRILEAGRLELFSSDNLDQVVLTVGTPDLNQTFIGSMVDWNVIALGGYFWLRDGAGLKISDAGDTDFVTFSHDGTDFNIAATNTGSFDITGASVYQFDSDIQARDGGWVSVKDATNADSLDLRETGSYAQVVSTVNPLRFYPVGTYALELTATKVTSPFTVDALDFWAGQNYYLVGGADSGVFAGYNIDSNAGVVSHLLTGAIAGVRYDNQGVTRFYNDTSQVASTVATPSMTIGNDSTVTFAGAIDTAGNRIDIQGASPRLVITETDGTLDNKVVRLLHSGEAFYMTFLNDAETVGTDFVQVTRTAESPDYWEFLNLDRVRVRDGASFWIMDAGDTDYVQFSHDGTDFNIAATNTTDVNFTGATNYTFDDGVQAEGGIEARTGSWNLAFDATNADYIYKYHSGTHGYIKTAGVGGGSIFLQPASGSVGVIAGFPLRIYDPTNVDYAAFQHNGTNFNATFAGTTNFDLIGLTGGFWVRDGAYLRVSDALDTDYVDLTHDGTDFNIAATNTTELNFTGFTRIKPTGDIYFGPNENLVFSDGTDTIQFYADSVSGNLEDVATGGFGLIDLSTTVRLAALRFADNNGIVSDNGHHELIEFTGITSAVNFLRVTNSITANGPILAADGTDVNIDLNLNTKGTGILKSNGTTVSLAGHTHLESEITDMADYLRADVADTKSSGILRFNDSVAATFGTSDDVQIDYNGTNFRIQGGTNQFAIMGGMDVRVYDSTAADSIQLKHDGTDALVTVAGTTDVLFSGATGFYQFSNDVRVAGGGFQSNSVVQTSGVDEQIVFVDVSGGRGRVGSYNWGLGTYQAMLIEGNNVRINTRGGDAEFYDSSTLWAHFDQSLQRFDYFGLDVRIRDGGDLFVYDATDTVYLQAYNDGTNSYLNASANQMRFHIAGALKMGVAATYNYDYQPRLQLQSSAAVADVASYGQWWVRDFSPSLPYHTTDTGEDRFLTHEGELEFYFDTATTAGDPGTGEIKCNSATPSVVVTFYISKNTADGRDMSWMLEHMAIGDMFFFKSAVNDNHFFIGKVSLNTDNTTYHSVSCTTMYSYGTGVPAAGEPVRLWFESLSKGSVPGGSVDNATITYDATGGTWVENAVLRSDPDAGEVRFYQPGTNDHMEFTNDGNDLLVTGVNLASMAFVNLDLEIRDNVNLQFGDIGDIQITFDTVDLEMTSLAGNWAWQLRDGVKLTLWDSTDADSVEFHHDGTDFNTTFGGVATTDWNIVGLGSYMWLRDGAAFRISDAGDTDYVEWNHTGVDLLETYTGTANKEVNGLTGAYKIKDGAELRVYDPADTDYITLNHNGTNANIDFDSTTDYLGIGLSSSGFDELRVSGVLKLNERPSAHTDTAAFGQLWIKNNTPNELWFTNDAGTDFPVGYNAMPIKEQDAAYTFAAADAGYMLHKDAGLALSFTCDNVAAIPQGTAWVVHNDDTEDLTIAQGTGVTINWLSGGAAPTAGNVLVKQGGIVTVYKYTDTEYWVWGNKEASAGIGNVVEDTTPQLGGDLDTNNFDILVGDGDYIKFGAGLDFTISHDGASNDLDINSAAGGSEIHLLNNMHLFFHGGAKTADFQYDGTDFAIFMSSADPFQLHGASQLDLRDGCDLLIRNSADTDYVTFAHNGTDFTMTGTNTANLNIVGMGLHLGDNLHQYFGDAEDVDIYFNATDLYVDLAAAVDFRLRGGSVGTDAMITAIADGGVYLYHNNVQAIATQLYNATGNTSAAVVDDHGGTARDIGFNELPTFNMNVSDTLEAQHCGKVTGKTNTTAYTLTGPASTDLDFPVGGVCTVMNLGTSTNYTISDTASCTMYHVTGSAVTDIVGSGTLAPGGIVTLWRYSSTAIYIWGSGFTA